MKKRVLVIFLLVLLTFSLPGIALAQTYSFSLEQETVNVYWNADGTVSIDYVFVFNNDPGASPIDFVDVGLPNSDFEDSSISADVDGVPLSFISRGDYQGSGTGVAIGLENLAIQPGRRGRVHVYIGTVRDMLRPDDQDENYASGVFSPTWFGSKYVHVRQRGVLSHLVRLQVRSRRNEPDGHLPLSPGRGARRAALAFAAQRLGS